MSTQELQHWQDEAMAEQEQALDAYPDPDHDLDEDAEAWHREIRELCGV